MRIRNFIICFSLFYWFQTLALEAQEINLIGKVIDAKSEQTLEGVVIIANGKNRTATTNTLGEFNLLVPDSFPMILTATYLGYQVQELIVSNAEPLIIAMEEQTKELDEVLIVSGYSVQKKRDFSGSVASIGNKQLIHRPSTSFDQLLGGLAPGVDLIQPSNILNNTPVLRIRGLNSITSGLFPLVVVDGVAMFTGAIGGVIGNNPLSDINPNDIASIDILKDASAAAIYGSRAANGVMVISTKKGKKGRIKTNYDTWLSVSTPFNLPELLSAEDYVMIKNEAMVNSGRAPGYQLMRNPDSSIVNTNWYDVAYKPGWSHQHQFSVSGANNATQYYFSLGYTDQNNFIKTNTFTRYNTRLNIDHQLNHFLKLGANLSFNISKNTGPITGAVPSNTLSSSAYNSQYILNEPLARMTFVLPPNVPVFNTNGTYHIQNGTSVGYGLNNPSTIGTINAYNLQWMLDQDIHTSDNYSSIGNLFSEIQLSKSLKYKTSFGLNYLLVENNDFLNPIHGGGAASNGVATNILSKLQRTNWINTLAWNKTVDSKHNIELLAGHEQVKTKVSSWGAERSNITDVYYKNYQGGYTNISPIGNVFTENHLLSFFSNLNYDFKKKYFISLNARRDGLSALSEGNKFGNFGGVSMAWNVHKETFFTALPLARWISSMRLRGSYGIVGNSEIGDYPAIGAFTSATYGGQPTLKYAQASNPDLQWETSKKLDIGLIMSFLEDKISLEFDYYNNLIDGMILRAPQAPSAGIPGNFINLNAGSMYNRGVELGIQAQVLNKEYWKYNINANLATLENKVTSLVADVFVPSIFGVQNMTRVGYSIGSIFAVPCLGVNPDNGLMMFVNKEGKVVQYNHIGSPRWTYLDGTAAPAIDNYQDGVIQGPSLPKWFGGFNQSLQYKNWELNCNFTFVMGNYLYNGTRATNSDQRYFNNGTFIKDRWTTPGQKTEIQKLQYGDNVSAGFSFSATSKVEKGDYLKLKSLQLAYHIPLKSTTIGRSISSARVYVQAVNLLTFTKYRGSDPEVSINGNSIHSGKDQNVPPNAQVFTLGLNVGF